MRKTLSLHMTGDDYFVHADMFNVSRFPLKSQVIDVGLCESNLLNIVAGISSQGKTVYVYGVAGFIIHHLQQLKLNVKCFGSKYGKIIICNAGKIGYESMGIGHKLDDDQQIMDMYDIEFYSPHSIVEFKQILDNIQDRDKGLYYIQLGRDYE